MRVIKWIGGLLLVVLAVAIVVGGIVNVIEQHNFKSDCHAKHGVYQDTSSGFESRYGCYTQDGRVIPIEPRI